MLNHTSQILRSESNTGTTGRDTTRQHNRMMAMDVFFHLLYEHSRGLRDLALYTTYPDQQADVTRELELEGVAYWFRPLEDGRLNVYFGHRACIDVIRSFGECPHFRLTPEQDFMLGIMLGYDRTRQCERFLARLTPRTVDTTSCAANESPSRCRREQDAEHAMD
jgi:hypothetical protein